MITHDPRFNKIYHAIDIPRYVYDQFQQLAYGYNMSTRSVITTILEVASHHPKECEKSLNKYSDKLNNI